MLQKAFYTTSLEFYLRNKKMHAAHLKMRNSIILIMCNHLLASKFAQIPQTRASKDQKRAIHAIFTTN